VSVTALALLLTCAPAVTWTVDGDTQLIGKRAIDASQSETHMLIGLRGGLLSDLDHGVVAGFDVGLHTELLPRVRGTDDVGSGSYEGSLWPRAVLGWRADWVPLGVMPYAFAGPFVGVRLAWLTAFGQTLNGSHPTWGVRGGGGLRFRVWRTHLSLEIGGGARQSGPEVYGVLSTGITL